MPKTIETEITINAPIDKVWETLMGTDAWKDWNPSFCFAGSPFQVGQPIEIHLKLGNGKPVVVHPALNHRDDAAKSLVWKGVLGGAEWMFHGFHSFDLQAVSDSRTRFIHQEDMKGLMMRLVRITGQVKTTRAGFFEMNEALKQRCESP